MWLLYLVLGSYKKYLILLHRSTTKQLSHLHSQRVPFCYLPSSQASLYTQLRRTMACSANLLKGAAMVVCVVLVMSSLEQLVVATYCSECASQCTSTCNAQVTNSCESIRTTKYQDCVASCNNGCRGTSCSSYCSSVCRQATDSGYSSCQSSVYKQCWDPCISGCNSNCTRI